MKKNTRFEILVLALLSGCKFADAPPQVDFAIVFDDSLVPGVLEGATVEARGDLATGANEKQIRTINSANDNTVSFYDVPVESEIRVMIRGEECTVSYLCDGESFDGTFTIDRFIIDGDDEDGLKEPVLADNTKHCTAVPVVESCKAFLPPCSNNQCGPGTMCVDDQCVPQCNSTNCPDGMCVDNACIPDGDDGGQDTGVDPCDLCTDDQVCIDNMCVDKEPPPMVGPLCVVEFPGGFIYANNLPGKAWDYSIAHFGRIEAEVCTPFKQSELVDKRIVLDQKALGAFVSPPGAYVANGNPSQWMTTEYDVGSFEAKYGSSKVYGELTFKDLTVKDQITVPLIMTAGSAQY